MGEQRDFFLPEERPISRHTCHATGCQEFVPREMWGCRKHWFMLPKIMRNQIWRYYQSGQEQTGEPSKLYLLAARDAVIWVAKAEGKEPDTSLYDRLLRRFD